MSERPLVLIIDDEHDFRAICAHVLDRGGYDTVTAEDGTKGLAAFTDRKPDLVVLDGNLPDMDGIEVCRRLRKHPDGKTVPVLMCVLDMNLPGIHGRDVIRVLRENEATRRMPIVAITASERGTPDVIKGLELGADEYMGKPPDLELFVVRIGALLRRIPAAAAAPPPQETLSYGAMAVLLDEHRVELAGKAVTLTHLEFKLLTYFLRHPLRVVTRGMLLEKVWGTEPDQSTRTVDKHVESLRKKLPVFGANVETVIRVGYLFRP